MSVEQHKDIVRRVVEALNRHDFAALDEFFAADVLGHHPYGPPMEGRDSLKQFMKMVRVAFPDLRLTVHEMIGEGDKLVSKYTATGTHKGEFMGTPPSGKPINFVGVQILHFSSGRVVDDWEIFDQFGLMQQLGLLPMPGGQPPQ